MTGEKTSHLHEYFSHEQLLSNCKMQFCIQVLYNAAICICFISDNSSLNTTKKGPKNSGKLMQTLLMQTYANFSQ